MGLTESIFGKEPDDVSVQVEEPTPAEREWASRQLELARGLRERVNDPTLMEEIYRNLPEMEMSPADRSLLTAEYAEIKGEIAQIGADQANMAFGQSIDDLVARGVMDSEQANRIRIENQAAVNATMSIYNKKLDASRIAMARSEYIKSAGQGLTTASIFANVDSMNKRLYIGAGQNILGTELKEKRMRLGIDTAVSSANTQADIARNRLYSDMGWGLLEIGSEIYGARRDQREQDELMDRLFPDKIPGRAQGGPVKKGESYMVGEEGAEVFVPDQDGTIIPNDEIKKGISKEYPAIGRYLKNTTIQRAEKPYEGAGGLEYFPAEELYNPNPGIPTIEIYDKNLSGSSLSSAIAGDMLHHLGGVSSKGPNDPGFFKLKREFLQTITKEQDDLDRRVYGEAVKSGREKC